MASPRSCSDGTVWDAAGKLLDGTLGLLPVSPGYLPVAADLDGDGLVELADGASVWKWKSGKWTLDNSQAGLTPGQVAVADFGTFGADPAQDDRAVLDGIAEIARGLARAWCACRPSPAGWCSVRWPSPRAGAAARPPSATSTRTVGSRWQPPARTATACSIRTASERRWAPPARP